MRRPECNMLPCDLEAALSEFDGTLDAEEEDQIRKLFPQYLFFHNEYGDDSGFDDNTTPVRVCHCTSCRESFSGVRANYAKGKMHHEPVNCPQCGAKLEALATYKYSYEMKSLMSWTKTAVLRVQPDGALLIEAGDARRRFNWDNLDGELDWYPSKRYYIGKGTIQMWEHRVMAWACAGETPELRWLPTKTVHEPFAPNCMGYGNYYGEYALIGVQRIRESTAFRYCQLEDFFYYQFAADLAQNAATKWTIQYLAQYALHPQLEMAVKFGLGAAVEELISDGKKNARYLNWAGTTPADFLRMSKQDAKLFLKTEGSFAELVLWKDTCKNLNIREFWDLAGTVGRDKLPMLAECAKLAGAEIRRAARYLESLCPKCAKGATHTPGQILQIWKDYLSMARKMGYDLKEETVAMPKDLQERHDAAAALIRLNASAAEMKKYKKRRRTLEQKYAFAMDGLSILVPVSSEEIVQEGKTLHHCVGGYAERHMTGATTILFLRKQRTPGRSFLTIELYEERGKIKIRQIHGYRNENVNPRPLPPREKYKAFLDAWLGWVNNGSPRDRDGAPVLEEKKTTEEVKTA